MLNPLFIAVVIVPVLLGAGVLSGASEDSYSVVDDVRSREALRESNRDGFVRRIVSSATISPTDRFGGPHRGAGRGAFLPFVGHDLTEGDARGVVDPDMHELPADATAVGPAGAVPLMRCSRSRIRLIPILGLDRTDLLKAHS